MTHMIVVVTAVFLRRKIVTSFSRRSPHAQISTCDLHKRGREILIDWHCLVRLLSYIHRHFEDSFTLIKYFSIQHQLARGQLRSSRQYSHHTHDHCRHFYPRYNLIITHYQNKISRIDSQPILANPPLRLTSQRRHHNIIIARVLPIILKR